MLKTIGTRFLFFMISMNMCSDSTANVEAKRLYDDLLTNYNRLIRPVGNNTDRLMIKMGLRLSQLIEVNLKNQIMTTSVWVEQEWTDYKLKWNPEDYGGVDYLHVPSEHIWLPDIVLYNNADGNYEVTIMTKAVVHHTGKVVWKPPAIYKSFCEIDLEYFPFDEQTCLLKFGSWTYDGYKIDLQHISQPSNSDVVEMGIDLHDFYLSVEWDVMKVPAVRHEKFYLCCEEPYLDIVFNLTLRRKTLFYTVNLIIPCVGLSFLSVLVFYLPSDSGEKVSLCISVLVSLTVFFLLLAEIIPPTSLTVPLLGKYLLFTMVLVTLSVVVTIAVLNVNFRSPVTHRMSPFIYTFCIEVLPKLLLMKRPPKGGDSTNEENPNSNRKSLTDVLFGSPIDEYGHEMHAAHVFNFEQSMNNCRPLCVDEHRLSQHVNNTNEHETYCDSNITCPFSVPANLEDSSKYDVEKVEAMDKTVEDARFIAQHVKNKDRFDNVIEDWKYIAMVLDRLFLWLFSLACILGTVLIILQAPSLYDDTKPIDVIYSKIAKKKMLMNMLPKQYNT